VLKLEHLSAKSLAAALPSAPVDVSAEELERLREARFVSRLNPAMDARQRLHLDDEVKQQAPIGKLETASVDLGISKGGTMLALAHALESAFNTLGQMTVTPLIIDTGASCCISPHQEDLL
jgi:hypothetical protein